MYTIFGAEMYFTYIPKHFSLFSMIQGFIIIA